MCIRDRPIPDEDLRGGFSFAEQLDALEQDDIIERPIWALHIMGCFEKLRHHFPPTSKLHEASWPGYPPGWQALWHGALWRMRLPDGTRRRASRPLMLAGYAELANLCSAEGDAYLTLAEASGRSKWPMVQ